MKLLKCILCRIVRKVHYSLQYPSLVHLSCQSLEARIDPDLIGCHKTKDLRGDG